MSDQNFIVMERIEHSKKGKVFDVGAQITQAELLNVFTKKVVQNWVQIGVLVPVDLAALAAESKGEKDGNRKEVGPMTVEKVYFEDVKKNTVEFAKLCIEADNEQQDD